MEQQFVLTAVGPTKLKQALIYIRPSIPILIVYSRAIWILFYTTTWCDCKISYDLIQITIHGCIRKLT